MRFGQQHTARQVLWREDAFTIPAQAARAYPIQIVVAGGFTYFAGFLGERGMSKAEAKKYLGAWADELTQTP